MDFRSPEPDGYRALRDAVAWADAGRRRTVLVSGEDAVRFVDGFCTAPLATLAPGCGSEAFFPDARGQVLLWATVLRGADGVWIDADPLPSVGNDGEDGAWSLAAHLERYHIRERLEIADRTDAFAAFSLGGPAAGAWLENEMPGAVAATVPGHAIDRIADAAAGILPGRWGEIPVLVVRGDWLGAGSFLLVSGREDRERLVDRLQRTGIVEASAAAVDAVRREEGRPSPRDIPARSLPQEFGRDTRAISFTKGCYLGQETVARIDALGHVNRRFVGIVTAAEMMDLPATVTQRPGGEQVGTITSAGPSPRFDGWLGVGLMRTAALAEGVGLEVDGMGARWVELPGRHEVQGGAT
jgi:folate-binding protein YgfZ